MFSGFVDAVTFHDFEMRVEPINIPNPLIQHFKQELNVLILNAPQLVECKGQAEWLQSICLQSLKIFFA